jgi:tetratricopeptide (TPR) repeat protein
MSQDPAIVRRAYDRLAAVAIMSGRIVDYERYRTKWRELQAAAGVGPPTLIRDSIYASVIDVALRRDTSNAVRRLEATLANEVPKFATMPFLELLHMSRAYSQVGWPDRAREVLELYQRNLAKQVLLAAEVQPIIENVRASLVLAEGKPRDAILIYRKSDMLPDGAAHECSICPLYNLGSAYDAAGMTDSAIIMYDAFVRTPYFSRLELRGWFDERAHPERLPLVYERLGNLYELKGDSSRAAASYAQFVELWKDADPDLQPRVASARSRIAALRGRRSNPH